MGKPGHRHRLCNWLPEIKTKIEVQDDGCWLWLGATSGNRYGYTRTPFTPGPIAIHRALYRTFRGPLEKGDCLDHLCRMVKCCNPWHLEVVTRSENTARGNRDRTLERLAAQDEDPFAPGSPSIF